MNIDKIIRESLDNVINQKEDILYHQFGFSLEKLRSILQKGLVPNDNGESNCVWFSKNTPFYNSNNMSTVTLTVNFNDEFKKNHRFSDDVSQVLVYDTIQPNEIYLKECPFCIDANTYEPILCIQNINTWKNIIQRKYGNISFAQYIINNKQLKNKNLIIFADLYSQYIEDNDLNILYQAPNIKLINLF